MTSTPKKLWRVVVFFFFLARSLHLDNDNLPFKSVHLHRLKYAHVVKKLMEGGAYREPIVEMFCVLWGCRPCHVCDEIFNDRSKIRFNSVNYIIFFFFNFLEL